jgi:hypothetical protein
VIVAIFVAIPYAASFVSTFAADTEPRTMRTVLVTLTIGDQYQKQWQDVCAPTWRRYAERHGYDVIAIDQPPDRSARAQMRSPAWQKCLVLRPEITGTYDRVVWLDADILINPDAPAITNGVPIEKIGAMDESVFPTVEDNRMYWNWIASEHRHSAPTLDLCRAAMDARDWHAFWGLPRRGDHIVQTGVLVLSPSHHRDLLEYVYNRYEDKGAAAFNYEMRPLSFEIQERKLSWWIDARFNALFPFLLILEHTRRPIKTETELVETIRSCLAKNYFLHLAGLQRMMSAAKLALNG